MYFLYVQYALYIVHSGALHSYIFYSFGKQFMNSIECSATFASIEKEITILNLLSFMPLLHTDLKGIQPCFIWIEVKKNPKFFGWKKTNASLIELISIFLVFERKCLFTISFLAIDREANKKSTSTHTNTHMSAILDIESCELCI